MKTANALIDSIVETQTNIINNWMDSAKKMQAAFTNGNIGQEGQSIYKEWLDKQMNILNNLKDSSASLFNGSESANPQDFFKNWFNQQASYAKQMADFNQSIYNSYASFGKSPQDYMSNFGQTNTAFTNIYNAWINTLNSSYDTMNKNMNGTFNKDMFSNFVQGNQIYAKMQEFFQPMAEAMQKGQFNYDVFKNYFTADNYKNLTRQIFGNLYNPAPVQEVFDNGIKQLQGFFTSQNNLSKEYFAQVQNIASNYPQLFSGNIDKIKELYSQVNDVFGKTFEPLLKMVNPGKEKENIEATISLLDKLAEYSIRQAELQVLLQSTTQKSIEKVAKQFADKYSDPKSYSQLPNGQELYNEWIKVNEQLFTELFASSEFSKVKAEALNLSMDVKKQFEKQFEQVFANYPVVFKTEVEELQKSIYDLKKQLKDLQNKMAVNSFSETDEDKNAKRKK
jgi:polyhydroxyalkanoate synthesis regulator phasin